MQIQGKVVVVTGGSNGIGRALSRAFAAQGARAVVIADQDEKSGQQVAQEIKATFLPTDVDKAFISQRKLNSFTRAEIFVRSFQARRRPFSNWPSRHHSPRRIGARGGL